VALSVASISIGCGGAPSPLDAPSTESPKYGRTAAESAVIVVLAKQLGKNPAEINTGRSLKDLGADELDLVEATMALEEELHISIADAALVTASGSSKREDLLSGLTVEKLAAVVAEANRTPNVAPKPGRPLDKAGEKPESRKAVSVDSRSPQIAEIATRAVHSPPLY
jgi:acyl carrier protein